MIRRSTWVLLGVFLLAVAAVWYLGRQPEEDEGELDLPPTPEVALEFRAAEVVGLRIDSADGEQISLERDPEGLWRLAESRTGSQLDEARIIAALTHAGALRSLSTLDLGADLQPFGLTQPAYTVEIELQDGDQHTLLVGGLTPTDSGYYVRVDGGPPQVIGKPSVDILLELLNRPPLLSTPELEPTGSATAYP